MDIHWAALAPFLAVTAVLSPARMNANTIFGDFGTGNAYNCCLSSGVFGPLSLLGIAETGARFTSSANFELTRIDVALSVDSFSPTDKIILTLNSDASGFPGGVLSSWTLINLPMLGTCCAIETVTPASPLLLAGGSPYWLVATPGTPDFVGGWNVNSVGVTDVYAVGTPGFVLQSGAPTPAFEVQGILTTPEPGTFSTLAASLTLFGIYRERRNRKAFRN